MVDARQDFPVGRTAKAVVDWLTDNFAGFFDGLAPDAGIHRRTYVRAEIPHPLIMVAIFAAIAYALRRSIGVTLLTSSASCSSSTRAIGTRRWRRLTLVLSSCILCMGIGVPIGIIAAHRPKFYRRYVRSSI